MHGAVEDCEVPGVGLQTKRFWLCYSAWWFVVAFTTENIRTLTS